MVVQSTSPSLGEIPADHLASALAGWSEAGHGALARRLAHAIRQAVASGLVGDQVRLPAERAMATALAVSRSTITAALDELRAEGVIASRQGSGTVVVGVHRVPTSSRIAEHFTEPPPEAPAIDLAVGNPPDPSHWPELKIDVCDLIADGGGPGVHPLGLDPLRQALARRHTAEGLPTDASQIHVTSGAHQAIALVAGACAGAGDAIAVEDTSYPGIFDIIENLRARPVPLATDQAGVLPDDLERVLATEHPKVLYVQGGPHNPTGRAPKVGRLRQLAAVLDRQAVRNGERNASVVIEDIALAELTFGGRVRPELVDLCRHAAVVTVGSFSKVAWGGLRIGWLRAPAPLVQRTMHLRLANDLGASVPAQLIVQRLLPHLAELAEHRRRTLATTIVTTLAWMGTEVPEWKVPEPAGGSVLWAELPVDDTGPFVQVARRHGVQVAPGSVARVNRAPDPHVRICVDRPWPVVEAGLQRLVLAWRDIQRRAEPVLG